MRFSNLALFPGPSTSWLDRLLCLAAGLPLLLALTLVATLISLSQANAANDPSCGGVDLVARLKREDPTGYAKLMAEGATIENGQSVFWKIEKQGLKPSWLLGTFHVTDPRVVGIPAAPARAFAAADTLIVESDEILDEKAAAMRLMAMPDLMMFGGKQTIRDFLSPEDEKMLQAGLIKRGIPLMAVIKMKPWLISSMMALSSCELSRKASGTPFLDMKLALDAKASGKQVKGLETMAEQLQAMADLPMEFHVRSLVSVVRYQDFVVDMMETATQLYLSGQASLVLPASVYFNPEKSVSDAADMAKFEQRLITDRNFTMAARAAPILAKGNVFMAVGAAHLPGTDGLVNLLRNHGFVVTAQ